MKIARVFPRKTTASPEDALCFFSDPVEPYPDVDEVHISVAFSYDIETAEKLAYSWSKVAPTRIGGPAVGDRGEDFVPGRYLKEGYVITSRGCPNNCWFCDVPKREGTIRELPITEGWNVLDSNLLACSLEHIGNVFDMLKNQVNKAQFTGGLEASRLTDTHVSMLWDLRPDQMFFAYDTEDDLEPLVEAGKKLRYADFTRRHLRCYVLIGWPKDSIQQARYRLFRAWEAGFMPMAMLWKNKRGDTNDDWRRFQREWARPAIIKTTVRNDYRGGLGTR